MAAGVSAGVATVSSSGSSALFSSFLFFSLCGFFFLRSYAANTHYFSAGCSTAGCSTAGSVAGAFAASASFLRLAVPPHVYSCSIFLLFSSLFSLIR